MLQAFPGPDIPSGHNIWVVSIQKQDSTTATSAFPWAQLILQLACPDREWRSSSPCHFSGIQGTVIENTWRVALQRWQYDLKLGHGRVLMGDNLPSISWNMLTIS
jgi:hypothetical protein